MKARRNRKRVQRSSGQEDGESSEKPLYCLCRSSRCDGFMIACDNCEEWYHGECINVTSKQAESIQSYYCQACRDEDPALRIVYKTEALNGRNRQKSSDVPGATMNDGNDHNARYSGFQSRKRSGNYSQPLPSKTRRATDSLANQFGESSDGEFDLDQTQLASPSSSYSQSHIGLYSSRSKYRRATPANLGSADIELQRSQQRRPYPRSRYPQPCGECESCKTRDNCGICEVCRSPKFKQGRSRQQCITKGKMCLANDSEYVQSWRNPPPRGRYGPPCGECENCKTKGNCGSCEFCRNPRSKQSRNRQFCLYRAKMCLTNDIPRQSTKYAAGQGSLRDPEYDVSFDDFGQSRYPPSTRRIGSVIGSKMRRGDHLPGGGFGNLSGRFSNDSMFSRRGASHQPDLFMDNNDLNDPFGMSPVHRNGSSSFAGPHGSNDLEPRMMRSTGGRMMESGDSLRGVEGDPNYDSDEDVVLPELHPCAGPACSKTAIRTKYCSQECQLRHESDSLNRMHSRYPNPTDQVVTPYALPYMDHLYCRHHRMLGAQPGYNADAPLSMQQANASIPDIYPDVYANFVGGGQSAVLDYRYDPLVVSSQPTAGYSRRIPVPHRTGAPDEYLALCGPGNRMSKVGSVNHARKFAGSQSSDHRMITLSGRRPVRPLPGINNADVLSPPVPLEAITPTMQSLQMYSGHLGAGGPSEFRVGPPDGESAAAAEILTAEASDLINVDGTSSSGVGGAGSMDAGGSSATAPAFRHGDEYYMMNENENIEINWPASPGGVATASAGTV